jgi:hypothetical protein
MFFLNGEALRVPSEARTMMRRLADERALTAPVAAPASFWRLAYEAYARGYLSPGEGAP